MSIKLAEVTPGAVVTHWFDTGAFGMREVYSRVLKVGAKKVRVHTEVGDEAWKYPEFFNRVVPEAELPELNIRWQDGACGGHG